MQLCRSEHANGESRDRTGLLFTSTAASERSSRSADGQAADRRYEQHHLPTDQAA
jgi:hypothetical protein